MLPLLAMNQTGITGALVVLGHASMMLTAYSFTTVLPIFGMKKIMNLITTCIVVRGLIIALLLFLQASSMTWCLLLTQVLDGIAGGFLSVCNVLVSAHFAKTIPLFRGRLALLLTFVKTVESIGAAFSNLFSGYIAENYSYIHSFLFLSLVGIVPLILTFFLSDLDDSGHDSGRGSGHNYVKNNNPEPKPNASCEVDVEIKIEIKNKNENENESKSKNSYRYNTLSSGVQE